MLKASPRLTGQAPSDTGTLATASEGDRFTVTFAGRWDVATVMAHERELIGMRPTGFRSAVVDISGVTLLDTIGAISVSRIRDRLARSGEAQIVGAHGAQASLLEQVGLADPHPIARPASPTMLDRVATLGAWAVKLGCEARDLVGFFGELVVVLARTIRDPRRLRLTSVVYHMQNVGINAMPIVGLLAFLIGIVLAYQSASQLQQFGADILIVNLMGFLILREVGILITAIIVAGRSGSAFTAEIGTMKINQEVDAMRTIGLDPMETLVVPRTIALMLMLVPLGFFADIVGLLGGAIMADLELNIGFSQFFQQFRTVIEPQHLWVGLIKAPFFAFVISMVGCYHGLQVAGSAESVGQHTTLSVVQSIFLVIALDAIFSVVFLKVGW